MLSPHLYHQISVLLHPWTLYAFLDSQLLRVALIRHPWSLLMSSLSTIFDTAHHFSLMLEVLLRHHQFAHGSVL